MAMKAATVQTMARMAGVRAWSTARQNSVAEPRSVACMSQYSPMFDSAAS